MTRVLQLAALAAVFAGSLACGANKKCTTGATNVSVTQKGAPVATDSGETTCGSFNTGIVEVDVHGGPLLLGGLQLSYTKGGMPIQAGSYNCANDEVHAELTTTLGPPDEYNYTSRNFTAEQGSGSLQPGEECTLTVDQSTATGRFKGHFTGTLGRTKLNGDVELVTVSLDLDTEAVGGQAPTE